MAESNDELKGPDLEEGVPVSELEEGVPLLGHAHGEAVILVSTGGDVHALDATCTHYGGPLAEGLVDDGTVRCPWHHAKFDLATGRSRAPALDSVGCYSVIQEGETIRVGERRESAAPDEPRERPESVVIVGGGAAGASCAERLREHGYDGPVTVISQEQKYPIDRPNLSKDYLAGDAPEEWLPVRPEEFYEEHDIAWKQGTVSRLDAEAREVLVEGDERVSFGALLLATGAHPRTLSIEGVDQEHVLTLRSREDSDRIASRAEEVEHAVVVGASFIGLEVAASLRQRDVEVTVVAPEAVPLENVLGFELGRAIQVIHKNHGVSFELGKQPSAILEDRVRLDDGRELRSDLVVLGVGVMPRTSLAEEAGLDVDDGVIVDSQLRTSNDDIYAAGDIARFPYRGDSTRIEHWVVAGRQGEIVARAMLGQEAEFDDVPFFWSRHYDVSISYVGKVDTPHRVEITGRLADRDATVAYRDENGQIAAVATIGRDGVSLKAELAMERGDTEALEALLQ